MQKRFQKIGYFFLTRKTPEEETKTIKLLFRKDATAEPRGKSPRTAKPDLKPANNPQKHSKHEKHHHNPKKTKIPAAETPKKHRTNKHDELDFRQPKQRKYVKESHSEHIVTTNKEHHHKSRKNVTKDKHASYWLTKKEILDLINQRVPSDVSPNQKFFVFDRQQPPDDSARYIEGHGMRKPHKDDKPVEIVYTRKSRRKEEKKRSRSSPVDESSYSKTSEQTVHSAESKKKSRYYNQPSLESSVRISHKPSRKRSKKLSKIHLILVDIPGDTNRTEKKKRNHIFKRYYERPDDNYNYQTYSDSNKKFASISEESSSSDNRKMAARKLQVETYTASVVARPDLSERPGKIPKKSRLGLYKSKIPVLNSIPVKSTRNGIEMKETAVEVDLITPEERHVKVKMMKESATSPHAIFQQTPTVILKKEKSLKQCSQQKVQQEKTPNAVPKIKKEAVNLQKKPSVVVKMFKAKPKTVEVVKKTEVKYVKPKIPTTRSPPPVKRKVEVAKSEVKRQEVGKVEVKKQAEVTKVEVKQQDSQPVCKTFSSHQYFKQTQSKVTTTSDLDTRMKKKKDKGQGDNVKPRQSSEHKPTKSVSSKKSKKSDSDSNKSKKSESEPHESQDCELECIKRKKSDLESGVKSGRSSQKSSNKSIKVDIKKSSKHIQLNKSYPVMQTPETTSEKSEKSTGKLSSKHISFTSSKSDTQLDKSTRTFERQSTQGSFSNSSTFGDKSIDSNKNNTSFLLTKSYRDEEKINRWYKRKMYSDLVRKNLLEKNTNQPVPQQVMEIHYVTVDEKVAEDCFKNDLAPMQKPPMEMQTSDQFDVMFGSPIDKAFEEILRENNQFLNKDFRIPSPIVLLSSDEDDRVSSARDWLDYPSADDAENVNKVYYCNERFNQNSEMQFTRSEARIPEETKAQNLEVDSSCSAPGSEESGYATINSKSFFKKSNIRALFDPPSGGVCKKEVQTEVSSTYSGDLLSKSQQTCVASSQKSMQFNISQEMFDFSEVPSTQFHDNEVVAKPKKRMRWLRKLLTRSRKLLKRLKKKRK